jgi:hypothetical protein
MKESDLLPEEEELSKKLMQHFAGELESLSLMGF